jgi:hypothetical protein
MFSFRLINVLMLFFLNFQINLFIKKGYVISYLDETRLKENPNSKWKYEHINANEEQKTIVSTIRKLKTDTTYYFKIQVRNNRAYGASSPTIIFKTPNGNYLLFT